MPKKLRPAVDLMAFKCRTLKVKLHFFRNNPLALLPLQPVAVKVLETFLDAICEHLFSSTVAFLIISVASPKRRPFSADLSRRGQLKISRSPVRGCSSVVMLFFIKKSFTKTDRCAGALSCRRNQQLVSPFFGAFPSNRVLRRRRMVRCLADETAKA
jgi:hypothetical protein